MSAEGARSQAEAENDTDVVQLLLDQHDEIRELFARVADAQPQDRAEAFQCLVRLLAVHETAEEEVVHPEARRAEGGADVVGRRVEEEAQAKQALADLEKLGTDDAQFVGMFAAFRTMVERHAASEENEEFGLLRSRHEPNVLRRMATEVKAAEAIAPTHPHPHGPDGMVGNLLVGPFAAVADRTRDAIKGHRS